MRYQPGMVIRDTYTLERLLGVGASGEVWKADDHGTPVAIKFMNENLLHGEKARKHRQRLEREIYALGLLQHPNIPRLHDYDLDFERPFVVMDYIDSPSFEYLISSGEMMYVPVTERLRLLRDIASALTSAHEAGIIHRDIKPGNIHGTETPYLLDFSVALEEESLEHTNFNVGTTIYMTPGGELPDRLADNYSFAVVAYEVLFGEHPIFPKNDETRTMGTYSRIVAFNRLKTGDWRKPSKLTPEQLPFDMRAADLKALDAVFTRALGDPAQRYVHLGELIDDLSRAILNEQTYELIRQMPSAPPPPPQTAPSEPRALPQAESFTVLEVEGSAPPPDTPTQLEASSPAPNAEEGGIRRLLQRLSRLIGRG
jgi:serine/threonine protein kinase